MQKLRAAAVFAGALGAALTFAACSSPSGSMDGMHHGEMSTATPAETAPSSTWGDADVQFAIQMIAHHQQVIEMGDVLLAKDGVDDGVAELAQEIKAAQEPEIDTMNSWLTAWGHGSGTDMMSGMEGMGHNGMMSPDDMDALTAASDAEAGALFLQQMIEHHRGATAMAPEEADDGRNPDAVTLAEKMVRDQTAEIERMKEMLKAL